MEKFNIYIDPENAESKCNITQKQIIDRLIEASNAINNYRIQKTDHILVSNEFIKNIENKLNLTNELDKIK